MYVHMLAALDVLWGVMSGTMKSTGDSLGESALPGGAEQRPIKASVTVRLDADVLAWLKGGGRGYQTRLNALLRQLMTSEAETGKSAYSLK
jgi:BrnA antitoxin of type II toxin-antitoxin system